MTLLKNKDESKMSNLILDPIQNFKMALDPIINSLLIAWIIILFIPNASFILTNLVALG